jgi:thiosulfate dehydrogenase (quinone) large subunit
MSNSDLVTRRTFLTVIASVATTAACSATNPTPAEFGDVSAGNVKDIPEGTLRTVGSNPVVIGRDAAGLYAMTITCTHEGCDVAPVGSGSSAYLNCPCHGSQFDGNGNVTRGPAQAPLVHFAVDVSSAGDVTIHGGKQVAADVRTPAA